jgi:ribosomal protein S18 acetylase RimI-like enzyme
LLPVDLGQIRGCHPIGAARAAFLRNLHENARKKLSANGASDVRIAILSASTEIARALAELLVETVADGGSVSFMHPLPLPVAEQFWARALAAADRGERVIFGAFAEDALVATVTLSLDLPPNQPHRAEIGKMMTKISHRHRGIATALMRAAEAEALARGRTLLVLDTAEDGGAAPLYDSLGFTLAGLIPDYALKPHGGLTGTLIYWKRLCG